MIDVNLENENIQKTYTKISRYLESLRYKMIIVERSHTDLPRKMRKLGRTYMAFKLGGFNLLTDRGSIRVVVRSMDNSFVGKVVTKIYSVQDLIDNDIDKLRDILKEHNYLTNDLSDFKDKI